MELPTEIRFCVLCCFSHQVIFVAWRLQYRNAICLLFSLFALLTDWTSTIYCNMGIYTRSKTIVYFFIFTIIVVNVSMKYAFSNDEITTVKPATVLAAVAEVSAI